MSPIKMLVLGAGGHSKVVISNIKSCNVRVDGIYDDSFDKSHQVDGILVLGTIEKLKSLNEESNAIIAIGDNSARKRISEQLTNLKWQSFIHPMAYVHPSVKIGKGVVVMAGAIIQPGSIIGDHVIINTGAIIEHDCLIGEYVHIAPGCKLAGGVTVAAGSLLGIGTTVIPKIRIGSWSVIGAASLIIKDIPNEVIAFGSPAKVKGTNE